MSFKRFSWRKARRKCGKIEKLLILQTSLCSPICFSSRAYKLTETRFYSKNIEFCCLRRKFSTVVVLIRKLENSQNNSIIKFPLRCTFVFLLKKQNSIFLIHKLFSWRRKKSTRKKIAFQFLFRSLFFNQTKRKNHIKTRKKERENHKS